MKRLFFTLLAVCMYTTTMWAVATSVKTDTNRPTDDGQIYVDATTQLYFYVSGGNAVITYINASADSSADMTTWTSGYTLTSLTIPETVSDGTSTYPVTKIGPLAFYNASSIQGAVTIPANITNIGQNSFYKCTGITEVTYEYGESVLYEDNGENNTDFSFGDCAVTKVNLYRNMEVGSTGRFCAPFVWQTTITEVVVGEHVTEIPNWMFRNTNNHPLKTVTCYALNPPSWTSGRDPFSTVANDCVLYVYESAKEYYEANTEWVSVFSNIQTMTDEEEVQPEGTLRDVATGLYFEIADGVTSIVADASGTYTDDNLVKNDDGSYTFPSYVEDKSGTNGNVTRIDESAFYSSHISGHLVIPAHILRIGKSAFKGCTGLTEVTYEYSETALEDENGDATANYSFEGCTGVTTVNLYRNVNLGSSSRLCAPFCYTTSITKVIVGENVTVIPSYMFRNTGNACLTEVFCYPTSVPTTTYDPFSNLPSTGCTLYVPAGCKNLYADAQYAGRTYDNTTWGEFFSGNIVEMESVLEEGTYLDIDTGLYFEINEDGTASIYHDEAGTYTDANLVAHSTITGAYTFPETVSADGVTYYGVTRIEANAFANSGISGHLVIPAYITAIGEAAFDTCTGLTEVTFEYSSTALLDENAYNNSSEHRQSFRDCTGIETVNLYRHINLGHGSGYLCGPFVWQNSIKTVNIGPRVDEIPAYMFRDHNSAGTQRVIEVINCYALTPPTTTYDPFGDITDGCVVNVPAGLVDTYAAASYSSSSFTGENETTWGGYFGEGNIKVMTDAFAITTHDNNEGTAYATFYNSASDVALFDDGTDTVLTAYSAYTLDKETDGLYIEIEEIGSSVPAATGVIVETEQAGTYLAIATGETTTFSGDNNLYGYDTATTISNPSGDYYYYLLSSNNSGQVGFYWGEENGAAFECQAHRAYLALSQSAVDGNGSISIRKGNGGGDTTGISSVEDAVESATVKGIYTLQGVRVSDMSQKGVYIVDGKKVLVK